MEAEQLLRRRVRSALELVHSPAAEACRVDPTRCRGLLRHVWAILQEAYGIVQGRDFYAVHRTGDPRNCLLLTRDEVQATRVRDLWAGPPVEVSVITAVDPLPERYVALGLALHWREP